jgi:hypothetical protein
MRWPLRHYLIPARYHGRLVMPWIGDGGNGGRPRSAGNRRELGAGSAGQGNRFCISPQNLTGGLFSLPLMGHRSENLAPQEVLLDEFSVPHFEQRIGSAAGEAIATHLSPCTDDDHRAAPGASAPRSFATLGTALEALANGSLSLDT